MCARATLTALSLSVVLCRVTEIYLYIRKGALPRLISQSYARAAGSMLARRRRMAAPACCCCHAAAVLVALALSRLPPAAARSIVLESPPVAAAALTHPLPLTLTPLLPPPRRRRCECTRHPLPALSKLANYPRRGRRSATTGFEGRAGAALDDKERVKRAVAAVVVLRALWEELRARRAASAQRVLDWRGDASDGGGGARR